MAITERRLTAEEFLELPEQRPNIELFDTLRLDWAAARCEPLAVAPTAGPGALPC